jgi:hypothetical protein
MSAKTKKKRAAGATRLDPATRKTNTLIVRRNIGSLLRILQEAPAGTTTVTLQVTTTFGRRGETAAVITPAPPTPPHHPGNLVSHLIQFQVQS